MCLVSTLLFGAGAGDADEQGRSRRRAAIANRAASSAARGRAWVRSTLVLVQMSLSFVLLVGAGLLIQSLQAVRTRESRASRREGVLTTGVDLFTAGYDRAAREELPGRARSIASRRSAASSRRRSSRMTPFSYRSYSTAPIAVDGYEAPPDEQPDGGLQRSRPRVSSRRSAFRWCRAANSRAPTTRRAPPVAVVNETMAAQFWRGADPVGRRAAGARADGCRSSASRAAPSTATCSRRRSRSSTCRCARTSRPATALQIRTSLGPAALAPALVREIHALDANVAPSEAHHDARAGRPHDGGAADRGHAPRASSAGWRCCSPRSASTA